MHELVLFGTPQRKEASTGLGGMVGSYEPLPGTGRITEKDPAVQSPLEGLPAGVRQDETQRATVHIATGLE
jgi:hypothetical protein